MAGGGISNKERPHIPERAGYLQLAGGTLQERGRPRRWPAPPPSFSSAVLPLCITTTYLTSITFRLSLTTVIETSTVWQYGSNNSKTQKVGLFQSWQKMLETILKIVHTVLETKTTKQAPIIQMNNDALIWKWLGGSRSESWELNFWTRHFLFVSLNEVANSFQRTKLLPMTFWHAYSKNVKNVLF